jgi:hypothetical protein
MNKLTFKEWSDLSDLQTIVNLKEDQEFSMARGELKTAQDAVKRLMGKLKGEGDLEAWVQSKITKAAEYLDTVADHLSHGEDDTVRKSDPQSKLAMKEGFKGHKSVEEIAKKHKVSPSVIQNQLEMGMKVEHEHTTDNDAAMDIALQHLDEIPNYYSKLKKMEKVKEDTEILDAEGNLFATVIDIIDGSNYKFKSFTQPITEDAVSELESQLKKLNNTSYDSIDKLMRNIMKEHDMTAKELHNAFTKKHDKTPDEWIKELKEEKKGLWSNIRSRREKGLPRKKPGEKGYPKTLHIEEGIKQARKNVGANKCWMGKKLGNPATKMKGGKEVPNCVPVKEESDNGADDMDNPMQIHFHDEVIRYCEKCGKNEKASECKYGEKYWTMFSIPSNLSLKKPFSIAKVHPTNEGLSFEVRKSSGAGALTPAAAAQLGPKAIDLQKKKAAGVDLPLKFSPGSMAKLADSVIQPGQLTNEDYQRIQSTGNVYSILFSWRGRPMMNLQLFFPSMNRPSKEEVKTQIEKLYPGAVIMQWHPSPTDPSKPIIVIQK